ncbi:hypothetical protein C8R45DRAFT_945372 [Mycena sanguinolenta]|nr:hypothetical protein C8R45DRAFT_945372 [Mycena sanguinolenta]
MASSDFNLEETKLYQILLPTFDVQPPTTKSPSHIRATIKRPVNLILLHAETECGPQFQASAYLESPTFEVSSQAIRVIRTNGLKTGYLHSEASYLIQNIYCQRIYGLISSLDLSVLFSFSSRQHLRNQDDFSSIPLECAIFLQFVRLTVSFLVQISLPCDKGTFVIRGDSACSATVSFTGMEDRTGCSTRRTWLRDISIDSAIVDGTLNSILGPATSSNPTAPSATPSASLGSEKWNKGTQGTPSPLPGVSAFAGAHPLASIIAGGIIAGATLLALLLLRETVSNGGLIANSTLASFAQTSTSRVELASRPSSRIRPFLVQAPTAGSVPGKTSRAVHYKYTNPIIQMNGLKKRFQWGRYRFSATSTDALPRLGPSLRSANGTKCPKVVLGIVLIMDRLLTAQKQN